MATNCVTDGVSGGVGDMKMIGMLVVHNFHQYINCISVYHFNECGHIILKKILKRRNQNPLISGTLQRECAASSR